MARRIAEESFGKFAFDIELLDVRRRCEFSNYFLIMSGKSRTHLESLADFVSDFAKANKAPIYGRDGKAASGWIVLDFGDLIVHIFMPETRRFYDLNSIWSGAKLVELGIETPAKK